MAIAIRKSPVFVFLLTASAFGIEYDFRTLNFPGAMGTNLEDINDNGTIVGWYLGDDDFSRGLVWQSEIFSSPELEALEDVAFYGINDSGVVAGSALESETLDVISFTLADGILNKIRFPDSDFSIVDGINSHNVVVGSFATEDFEFGSFQNSGDRFEELKFDGFTEVTAYDINNNGVIVGSVLNANDELEGFVLDDGVFSTFNHADGETELVALNDIGDIVGVRYTDEAATYFIFDGNEFHDIAYPGAAISEVWGINNRGDIVGSYLLDESPTYQGFIGTRVPEPNIWHSLVFVVISFWPFFRQGSQAGHRN